MIYDRMGALQKRAAARRPGFPTQRLAIRAALTPAAFTYLSSKLERRQSHSVTAHDRGIAADTLLSALYNVVSGTMKGGVRWVLAVALLLVAVLYTSHAFMPTATNWDAESQSHQTITERAVLAAVERLLSRSAAARRYLPEKSAILSSASFQEVLGKLTDAAGWPDFDHTAAQDPGIHFNDEQIVDAAERLRRLRLDAVYGLNTSQT